MRTKEENNLSSSATEFFQALAVCKRCVDAHNLSSNEQVEHTLSQRATLRETNFPLQQCSHYIIPNLLKVTESQSSLLNKKIPQSWRPSNVGQLKNDTFPGRFKAIHCGDNSDTELSVCLQMEVAFYNTQKQEYHSLCRICPQY